MSAVREVRAVPKPPMAMKQKRKRLQSRPRSVDRRAAEATFERDAYLCQWCRRPGGRLVPHHRLRRSQGGLDVPEHMVSVHPLCHREIHDRVAEAKKRGFLVSRADDLERGWV